MGKQSTRPSIYKKKYHVKVQRYKDLAIHPRVMDSKTSLSTLCTLQNQTREEEPRQKDCEQDGIKHIVAEKLINIGSTIEVQIVSLFEDQPRYYVNMLKLLRVINHGSVIEPKNMVENLAQPLMDEIVELRNFESSTQVA